MMKSFFKKLAFVMALAMVVSMAAPAAQKAVAAEDKALAIAYQKGAVITALNLAEVGATEDLRFVYAPENWKELDVVWTSSNPNVVAVDQNGVVEAKAAGTATVTVAVGTETASVDVYSVDMKAFDVTIGTAEERALTEKTLKVGDAVDFKFFGVKDYDVNRYNCVWGYADVLGEDVVEFDAERGDVVAKNPGKVVVTLTVINKITLASIKVQNVEVTVESETPVVDNGFTVKQKNSDTVEVTFANKEIAASAVNFKASSKNNLFTNDDEFIQVGELKDGVVTVKFYNGLVAGTTYTLTNGEESVTFDACTGLVDKIVISYKCCKTDNVAYAGQTVSLSAKVYSGDVEVTANNGINFKHSSSLFGTESTGSTFYAVQAGEVVAVTATYYNTGSTTPVVATIAVPVVALPEYKMKTTDAAMGIVDKLGKAYDNKGINTISTSDLGRYMTFETTDILGGTIKGCTDATGAFKSMPEGIFRFTTTNDTILGVSESNGALYPRNAGSAVIQVWFVNSATGTKSLVGSKQVTVYGPRVLNQFTLAKTESNNMASTSAQQYAMIASEAGADNYSSVTFTFNVKDQLGDKINTSAEVKVNNWDDEGILDTVVTPSNGEVKYAFTVKPGYTMTNAYKDIELTLKAKNSVEMSQTVVVRIFNVDYSNYNTYSAFVHSTSATTLGVLGKDKADLPNTDARVLKAGVVGFSNNAYNDAQDIMGTYASIKDVVKAANEAKAKIQNTQNVPADVQEKIDAATALVAGKGWYYEVKKGWEDVSTKVATSATMVTYTVRGAAAASKTAYVTDLSKTTGNMTPDIAGDVFADTKDGATVTFNFYQVVYNQYTSRYEYVTKTITKSLTNSDRATIGGSATVIANSVPNGAANLNDFVQKYIHVTLYNPSAYTSQTLCDHNDCGWATRWGGNFTLVGVKTNGQGVYTNLYYDSQTVNNWAYIVSLYVKYTNGNEVVTVEIPVNTRVEW